MTKFFDSHGELWTACAASDAGAVAFGPSGISRLATTEELIDLCLLDGDMTPLGMAAKAGRVDWPEDEHPEQWPMLRPVVGDSV